MTRTPGLPDGYYMHPTRGPLPLSERQPGHIPRTHPTPAHLDPTDHESDRIFAARSAALARLTAAANDSELHAVATSGGRNNSSATTERNMLREHGIQDTHTTVNIVAQLLPDLPSQALADLRKAVRKTQVGLSSRTTTDQISLRHDTHLMRNPAWKKARYAVPIDDVVRWLTRWLDDHALDTDKPIDTDTAPDADGVPTD